MKNLWLEEIEIKKVAEDISTYLDSFLGEKIEMEELVGKVLSIINKCQNQRIKDALLWRYYFIHDLDNDGIMTKIEFIKLPWAV